MRADQARFDPEVSAAFDRLERAEANTKAAIQQRDYYRDAYEQAMKQRDSRQQLYGEALHRAVQAEEELDFLHKVIGFVPTEVWKEAVHRVDPVE